MSFHVFVHPNPGQAIPKWWAYGKHGTADWVCWGKLGQMTSKSDHAGAGPAKRSGKESEGYQDLGSFTLTEKELSEAMRKTFSIWARSPMPSASPEERRLLESFCRKMGISLSLIQGSPVPTPTHDPAPATKPKKSRPVKKVAISDLSESWF